MPVYFVRRTSQPDEVKIGFTANLRDRMGTLAAQYGPIELVATMSGNETMERLIHERFGLKRLEGEWFYFPGEIAQFIEKDGMPVGSIFEPRSRGWKEVGGAIGTLRDQVVASNLVTILMDKYPASVRRTEAQEAVFKILSADNRAWSRRRVRAIYERQALRIELFEVLDLLRACGIDRSKWVDFISPLQAGADATSQA
jgi:hypothetical protein